MVSNASLIIPIWNEMKSGRLLPMIDSIREQTVLPDEVIFVDGLSDDGTYEYLKEIGRQTDGWINVVSDDGGNIATARNRGVLTASNNLLLFTDAGCILPTNWVESMLSPLANKKVDVVVGGYEGDYTKGDKMEEAIATTIIKPMHRWTDDHLPSGRSLALKRQAFDVVGGYPEWMGYSEDTEFDLMLKDAGMKFYIQKDAPVKWSMGGKVGVFFKKLFNYGIFDAHNPRLRKNIRMPLAVVFVLLHLMLLIIPIQIITLFVAYVLFEGFYLAYANKRWYLLSQYISIGWLKRYAYFSGYIYGLLGGNKRLKL